MTEVMRMSRHAIALLLLVGFGARCQASGDGEPDQDLRFAYARALTAHPAVLPFEPDQAIADSPTKTRLVETASGRSATVTHYPDGRVRGVIVPRGRADLGAVSLGWPELLAAADAIAGDALRAGGADTSGLALADIQPVDGDGLLRITLATAHDAGVCTFFSPPQALVAVAIDCARVGEVALSYDAPIAPDADLAAQAVSAAAAELEAGPDEVEVLSASWLHHEAAGCPEDGGPYWTVSVALAAELAGATDDGMGIRIGRCVLSSRKLLHSQEASLPADYVAHCRATARDAAAYARGLLAPTREVTDPRPSWGPRTATVTFLSRRPRAGAPWWYRRTGVAMADLATGDVCCLSAAWISDLDGYALSGMTLLTTTRSNPFRVTDLMKGVAFGRSAGGWCSRPALRHSADLFVFAAERRHGDLDVFADGINWENKALDTHRRIVRVDGPDERPVFSVDGQWVYYAHADDEALKTAHEEGGAEASVWSLFRVRADAPHQNTAVEEVLAGFGRVGRMSFFPDGRRLLVWHEGGLDVVDVEARTREPLGLPDLLDPDLLDGPPLKIQDPVVSPDGACLAFSGYRDAEASDKLSGWYIYVCDLDGSNLERITPLEDDPVDFYVFPESGKSAFDLEKEMILERERQMSARRE